MLCDKIAKNVDDSRSRRVMVFDDGPYDDRNLL